MDRPGLLHVPVEAVPDRRLASGGQVRTNTVDLFRTRRMKARDLPSGEGVGRMEPPGPVTKASSSPFRRSSLWIT
jgi:hypothetical protein